MIESESYPNTLDAVVRYQERELATLQWSRKSSRAKGEFTPPEMPAMTGQAPAQGKGHASER